jgi:H+-translocating NAD(P) transhydrogenase subunit alpha
MKIAVPKENFPGERRVALTPAGVASLTKLGAEVEIETGMGESIAASDHAYRSSGASIGADRLKLLAGADLVLRVRKPSSSDVAALKPGAIHISFLDPFRESELLDQLASRNVSAISMEMIPRTTLAQKMDALSSQANLAGYIAVILAAEITDKVFPMMTTPAGTISPCKVFVIGAGVAGLQAIATAKRLGARVEAFDTRPVVEEQVRSLGARFVKADLGETGQTEQGYAKALTEEQLARQREVMAQHCAQSDIVITTAQVFGAKAPLIITSAVLSRMKKGSVVMDLAVETGGNVEGSRPDEVVDINGVRVAGFTNLPSLVPVDASLVYSNNLVALVTDLWDKTENRVVLKTENEVVKACLLTHEQRIWNERLRKT